MSNYLSVIGRAGNLDGAIGGALWPPGVAGLGQYSAELLVAGPMNLFVAGGVARTIRMNGLYEPTAAVVEEFNIVVPLPGNTLTPVEIDSNPINILRSNKMSIDWLVGAGPGNDVILTLDSSSEPMDIIKSGLPISETAAWAVPPGRELTIRTVGAASASSNSATRITMLWEYRFRDPSLFDFGPWLPLGQPLFLNIGQTSITETVNFPPLGAGWEVRATTAPLSSVQSAATVYAWFNADYSPGNRYDTAEAAP